MGQRGSREEGNSKGERDGGKTKKMKTAVCSSATHNINNKGISGFLPLTWDQTAEILTTGPACAMQILVLQSIDHHHVCDLIQHVLGGG